MSNYLHNKDIELYDVDSDPLEIDNLALEKDKYGNLIAMLNTKMNRLIEEEVGEDIGQMLPSGTAPTGHSQLN